MKCLYRFYLDCGRMGEVESLFIATPDDIAHIVGKRAYFGEILGKHSEIYCTITNDHISLVTSDEDRVNWLYSLLGRTISGHNPLEYIEEDYD